MKKKILRLIERWAIVIIGIIGIIVAVMSAIQIIKLIKSYEGLHLLAF